MIPVTLAILLPTRGRPQNFERFMRAFEATAQAAHVFVRLDHDDPTDYDEFLNYYHQHITVVDGPRVGFGASLNELAALAEREGYSHLGMLVMTWYQRPPAGT